MSKNPVVELRAGDLRLALCPDLGACIAGLWKGETPVLRSTEPDALAGSRTSGCYPLVPYSNRIGWRRFSWLGQSYSTAQNFDDNPHSVHGVAWQRPWTVVTQRADFAELAYTHEPDAHWPFAFQVRQLATLTPDALDLRLVFSNRADVAQPAGLGWHPYFPKRAGARLDIAVTQRWDSDDAGLPVASVAQDGIRDAVASLRFDNCFSGFSGAARIDDDALSLQLSSDMVHLVVFTPDTKPYYCVEPVSHVSNAIQMADPLAMGLQAVAPGASIEGWMKLNIAARMSA